MSEHVAQNPGGRSCADCRYSLTLPDARVLCRALPPVMVLRLDPGRYPAGALRADDRGRGEASVYPVVGPSWWCGAWSPSEQEAP